MRSHCSDKLGEEPIYCEAHHGERHHDNDPVYWSGSEDEYYEAPEHRRLRIEAKAIQFLSGNVPYLLSATLHGPFDKKSWDNPWKSKRAQRRAEPFPQRRVSRSRRSLTNVEAPRGYSSPRATDDLPNTQRTSLYPLPSPETTTPPSAEKNDFLNDDNYNRIKGWREAVQSIPMTKDPFWAGQQLETEHAPLTRKRSADQDWLHTREPKKPKSVGMRPSESPSQAAAKTREKQAGRFSDTVNQSAPVSFAHEDELAAHQNAPNLPIKTSAVPLKTRKHQSSKRLLPHRDLGMSEDELSIFSTTPSPAKAARSSRRKSAESAGTGSPTRRRRDDKGVSVRAAEQTMMVDSAQELLLSASQRPDLNMVKRFAKGAARRVLGASQQDNSFYFHARPKNSAEESQTCQSPTKQLDDTTFSFPAAQVCAPVSQLEDLRVCGEGDNLLPDDDDFVMADREDQMGMATTPGLRLVPEPVKASGHSGPGSEVEAKAQPQRLEVRAEGQNEEWQKSDVAHRPQQSSDDMCIKSDHESATPVCTQELSPVSMRDAPATAESAASADDAVPQRAQSTNADASDPDWSTYINTQDLFAASENSLSGAGHVDSNQVISQDADDPTDPNWTTFVNTQDLAVTFAREGEASEAADDLETVEQGPDDLPDPDWSTFVSTHEKCTTHETNEDLEGTSSDFTNVGVIEQDESKAVVKSEVDTGSDWSIGLSTSSQANGNETGNTSHEPVQARTADSGAKFSQVSIGGIIDAYAEDQSLEEFSDQKTSDATAVTLQDSMTTSACRGDEEVSRTQTSPRQGSDVSIGNLEDISASSAQLGNGGSAVTGSNWTGGSCLIDLDGTTASLESTQTEGPPEEKDNASQTPGGSPGYPNVPGDFGNAHDTTASTEPQQLQSPWHTEGDLVLRTPAAPLTSLGVLDETTASIEEPSTQSPWAKEGICTPLPVVVDNETTVDGSSSNLSVLAGAALAITEAPQTPWLGDKLPSPNFSLSVKKFSDFMKPSPTKKRASANGSILRGTRISSRSLFGTPVPLKAKRRVTFALLSGEEEASHAEIRPKDDSESCVAENVSYFDFKGNKTTSLCVARRKVRAASPPPLAVSSVDADELPDHDHRFASHFEAMSKRKKSTILRAPRLLPSNSQQTSGSQEVGAMAEAFIQASQTMKKSSELAGATADGNIQDGNPLAKNSPNPMGMDPLEEQENIEPVDDVSAVLDNLDDYFGNTWGVDTSMDIDMNKETQAQQQTQAAASRVENIGDPMMALHVNIWAD